MKTSGLFVLMIALVWMPNVRAQALRDALAVSRAALAENNTPAAVAAAAEAVEADPGSFEAWRQYARSLHLDGQDGPALQAYQTARSLRPDDEETARWLLRLQVDSLRGDELREALQTLRDIPFSGQSLAAAALSLWENERSEDAVILLETMSTSLPVLPALRALRQGDRTPAETATQMELDVEQRKLLLFALGTDAASRARLDEALELLDRFEALEAGRLSVRRERGWVLQRLGRRREAEEVWRQDPAPPKWWLWIALSQHADQLSEEALESIDPFLSEHPDHVEALSLKAHLLHLTRGGEAAGAFLDGIADEVLREHTSRILNIRIARGEGRLEEAALLLRALHEEGQLHGFLVKEYERLLQEWALRTPMEQRAKVLRHALAWQPDRLDWQRDLAWSLWQTGQREEAVALLDRALEQGLEPRENILLQVVARLVEENQMDAAMRFLRKHSGEDALDLAAFGHRLLLQNRMLAARPVLQLAWEQGGHDPVTGLHLAYTLAMTGACSEVLAPLRPFLNQLREDTPKEQTDLLLETLHHCPRDIEWTALLREYPVLQEPGRAYAASVTTLLAQQALYLLASHQYEASLTLFERVLSRDPLRPLWSRAIHAAQQARGREAVAEQWLAAAPLDQLPAWEAARIRGIQHLRQSDPSAAAAAYQESLEANPDQADLTPVLFRLLLALGREEEAERQMHALRMQVDRGEVSSAAAVAEMLDSLARPREALYYWELARLQSPRVSHYTRSAARTLAAACRHAEAMDLIQSELLQYPRPELYALAGEFALTLGEPRRAADLADSGLALEPKHPGLLRFRAELAERHGDWPMALDLTRALLAQPPAANSVRLLHARALTHLQFRKEAVSAYEEMLATPELRPVARARLRELYTLENDMKAALEQARLLHQEDPDDVETLRLLAATLAEARSFQEAIDLLTPLARRPVHEQVPVLLFSRISACPVSGLHTLSSLDALFGNLREAGWEIVDPQTLFEAGAFSTQRRVVILLEQPATNLFVPLAEVLRRHEGVRVGLLHPERIPAAVAHVDAWVTVDDVRISDPGFVDLMRATPLLNARRVPAHWTFPGLEAHLVEKNPMVQARLTLGKVYYWHGQHPSADAWLDAARAAGANPFEVSLNKGLNALRGGDLAMARLEIENALALEPGHALARAVAAEIIARRRPALTARYSHMEESDDRTRRQWGAQGSTFLTSRLEMIPQVDRLRYTRKNSGDEDGLRSALDLQYHLTRLTIFRVGLHYDDWDNSRSRTGWNTSAQFPLHALRGQAGVSASRNHIETLEAIREGLYQDVYGMNLYSRIHNDWDFFLNGHGILRSDDNDTGQVEARLLYRLAERPYIGVGLSSRYADTEADNPLYYTPREMQKHQVQLQVRGPLAGGGVLRLRGEAGVAREAGDDWIFVWGARAELGWKLHNMLELLGGASYMESPRYDTFTGYISLKVTP